MVRTLTGSNSFLLGSETQKIIDSFIKIHGEFALERFNAGDRSSDELLGSVQALPFLADKKLVIIDSPSSNKDLTEKISQFLGGAHEQVEVLIIEPKIDKRSLLYKTLKKQTDYSEFNQLDERNLTEWVATFAKEQGAKLTHSDAGYLVRRVGTDQLQLSHEIEKLTLYDATITRQSIDLLTQLAPQSSIFNLLDAVFAGDTKRAAVIYQEQRKLKVEPQAILAMIAWQLHVIALIKTSGIDSADAITRETKLSPFVVRKAQTIARQMTLTDLKKLIRGMLQLDMRLKSEALDADDAVQATLTEISTR